MARIWTKPKKFSDCPDRWKRACEFMFGARKRAVESLKNLCKKDVNMVNVQVLQMLGNMEYSLNYDELNTSAQGQVTFRSGDNKTNFMFDGCKNRYDIVSRCQECMRWSQKNHIDGSTGVVALSNGNEYNFNFGQ